MVAFTESPQLVHISKIITPSIMTKHKQLISSQKIPTRIQGTKWMLYLSCWSQSLEN